MEVVSRQPKISCTYAKVINIYIVYELGTSSSHDDDPTLKNCLFGAVTLTKNVDIDKYHDSGYGIGFHWKGSFYFSGSGISENVIIFGADTSSSVSVGNEGKYILILGSGPTQGLGEHSLSAEKMHLINFTVIKKKFCLSLLYNSANSYLFVNGTEIYKFKAKDSEIVATLLSLENISKDWSVDNMKKTGFNCYVHDFSVDYCATDVDDIVNIHNYLMKKKT